MEFEECGKICKVSYQGTSGMKLTKEGYESLVDFLKTEVVELTNIKDWVKGGASISRDDRDNEVEYFDKAYSIFQTRCESISHSCDHLKSHLDSMREDPDNDK